MAHLGLDPRGATAAVQGFGKVGADAARFLAVSGLRVTAVSDQYGAIANESGLDINALAMWVQENGSVVGFDAADAIDRESPLLQDVDVLVRRLSKVWSRTQRRRCPGASDRGGGERPDNAGRRPHPRRARHAGGSRHSGERRRRSPTSNGFRRTRPTGGKKTRSKHGSRSA